MVAKKVRDSLPLKLSAQWELDATRGNGQTEARCRVSPPTLINKDSEISHCDLARQDGYNDMYVNLKESFLKAFKVMDKELKLHPHIDCFSSGTTSVALVKQVLIYVSLFSILLKSAVNICGLIFSFFYPSCDKQGRDLIIGNVGDSRAVLGTRDKSNSLIAVQLTVDLKPNLPSMPLFSLSL